VRKKHVVSKYHKVVAKEKRDLGAWSAKLKKIYAETENTVDEDPLERFGAKKKKRKKDVNSIAEDETCQKETGTADVVSNEVLSQRSAANGASETPSTTSSNLRSVHTCCSYRPLFKMDKYSSDWARLLPSYWWC